MLKRTAETIAAASVLLGLVACRPAAESADMPIVLRVEADGVTVTVPVCNDDNVARFDISAGDSSIESRRVEQKAPGGLVLLTVNASTIDDGTFNPEEVKVLHRSGNIRDPNEIENFFVSTTKGFAEWGAIARDAPIGSAWLINGRNVESYDGDDTALENWCD